MRRMRVLSAALGIATGLWGAQGAGDGSGGTATVQSRLTRTQQQQLRAYEETLVRMRDGKAKVSPDELFQQRYQVAARGAAADMATNAELAQKFARRAQEVGAENRTKGEQLMQAAKAYNACADSDRKLVAAYKKGDAGAVDAAIAELVAAEKLVERAAGSRPERDWLTPDELDVALAQQIAAKRTAQGGGQK